MHGMRQESLQMPMSSMAAASPVLGSVGMVTKEGVLGTPSAPIHMVTAEGGLKVQAWRTLRTLALGFLLLSGVGALIEDRGIGKGELSEFVDTRLCFHILFANKAELGDKEDPRRMRFCGMSTLITEASCVVMPGLIFQSHFGHKCTVSGLKASS
jgi:hypothetical protein